MVLGRACSSRCTQCHIRFASSWAALSFLPWRWCLETFPFFCPGVHPMDRKVLIFEAFCTERMASPFFNSASLASCKGKVQKVSPHHHFICAASVTSVAVLTVSFGRPHCLTEPTKTLLPA